MTLSPSWTTVPVTGTYGDRTGAPLSGSVEFRALVPVSVDGILVVPTTFTAEVVAGVLSTSLPVTADAGTQAYTVVEHLAYARAAFSIVVVFDSSGIDLTSGAVGSAPQFVQPGATVSLVEGPTGPTGPKGEGVITVTDNGDGTGTVTY